MTDNEVILTLSHLLEPVITQITDIKNRLDTIESKIITIEGKIESMQGTIEIMQDTIKTMQDDIKTMQGDIRDLKDRTRKIELTQENIILPRLQNIEACYTSTFEKYKNSVDEHESMKQDISILKTVVTEHSLKLQRIS